MERPYTGFVDDRRPARVKRPPPPHPERAVDIVYRARNPPTTSATTASSSTRSRRSSSRPRAPPDSTDISTDIKDTKYGDAWFDFLASGPLRDRTESGSSALDPVGTIRRFEAEWRSRTRRPRSRSS